MENLSFKSNKIDIKDIPNYNDKILTVNNISIVDLIFKLDTMSTEVIFNNKSIKDTNISIDDFNKVKDNIEKYKQKLADIDYADCNKSIYDLARMFVAMFLLSLSVILTFITAYDYDKEN